MKKFQDQVQPILSLRPLFLQSTFHVYRVDSRHLGHDLQFDSQVAFHERFVGRWADLILL